MLATTCTPRPAYTSGSLGPKSPTEGVFSVDQANQRLFYSANKESFADELDDDSRELRYYGVASGGFLKVEEG